MGLSRSAVCCCFFWGICLLIKVTLVSRYTVVICKAGDHSIICYQTKLHLGKNIAHVCVLTSVAYKMFKMLFTAVSSVPLLSVLQHNLIGDHIIFYDPNNTMQFYWKLLNDNMNTNYCPAVILSRNLLPVNVATLHNLSVSLSLCFVFAFICLLLG